MKTKYKIIYHDKDYIVAKLEKDKKWHPCYLATSKQDAKLYILAQQLSHKQLPESIYF